MSTTLRRITAQALRAAPQRMAAHPAAARPPRAPFSSTPTSPAFTAAVAAVKQLTQEPGNDVKLQMYALFKRATAGPNTTPKPGMFDVVGKYKWQAWTDLNSMSQAEAEEKYVAIANSLGAGTSDAPTSSGTASPESGGSNGSGSGGSGGGGGAAAPATPGGFSTLEVSQAGGVRTITLARPDKRNAINIQMYKEIMRALEEAATDSATRVAVLTGKGSYYCSGNDLSNFTSMGSGSITEFAESARVLMQSYVSAFIRFPKLLIVAVNGPAVGIPVTTLPLADFVLATHSATFSAPLVGLGQVPEGCSSVTFPRLMGHAKATEILVFGKQLTAGEAKECGLVNEVVEDGAFRAAVARVAAAAAELPPNAALQAKKLLRGSVTAELERANEQEGAVIKQCWLGPEVQAAVMKFLTKGGSGGGGGGASAAAADAKPKL